ncbi:hypothetical protein ID866_9665 [Astraeus odoratus]|nr:hypothetical protein ID866_9665 [Astraeus odoratus]
MSSPHHTLSPHVLCLAKTKAPQEHTEKEWWPVSEEHQVHEEAEKKVQEEAKKKAWEEAKQKAWEEAKRKAEEEHKAQEVAVRAKEDVEREEAVQRAVEAAEERADIKRRALEEQLWEAAGQWSEMAVAPPWVAKPSRRMTVAGPSIPEHRASGVQDPCTRCHNKGTPCMLGAAKSKTMVCEACHHTKASCSWSKKTVGETQKWKWVQRSEEMEEREVVDVDEDKDKEWSHFAVPNHLMEEHQDALRALAMTLDMLSMEFYKFQRDYWGFSVEVLKVMDTIAQKLKRANDLREEEMGRSKGKGKEKGEWPRRGRMEDKDGDTEMGRAGPSSLV